MFDMTCGDGDNGRLNISNVSRYALFNCDARLMPDVMCAEPEEKWRDENEAFWLQGDTCNNSLRDFDCRDGATSECRCVDLEHLGSLSLSKLIVSTTSNLVCAACENESGWEWGEQCPKLRM